MLLQSKVHAEGIMFCCYPYCTKESRSHFHSHGDFIMVNGITGNLGHVYLWEGLSYDYNYDKGHIGHCIHENSYFL